MRFEPKQTAIAVMRRHPIYRVLPGRAIRTYAALQFHRNPSSADEVLRLVRSAGTLTTRRISTSIVVARALFLTGQDNLLAQVLTDLERRAPDVPAVFELCSDLHAFHGRHEQALLSAERARLLKPSSASAVARVVRLSYVVRGQADADHVAVTALRRFPRSSQILWAVAKACASPDQYDRLKSAWDERATAPTDLLVAVRQLAMAAARAGEVDAAVKVYRRALLLLAENGHAAPTLKVTRLEGRGAWRAIEDLCRALDVAAIPYFYAAGTALGLVREGRPLGADGDIDVGIFDRDWDRDQLVNLFRANPRFEIDSVHPRTRKIGLRHRGGSPIDLFRFYEEGGTLWHDAVFVRWHNTPFEVERRQMRGLRVPLPMSSEAYLTENYGEWRVPNPAFDAFTDDAPNVEVTWPDYARLHFFRRAYKHWVAGVRAEALHDLERAGETAFAAEIGLTK